MSRDDNHLATRDLLAVRAGEGSAHAAAHLEECEACRTEFEKLYQVKARLRALPTFSPPRDRWPEVRAEFVRQRSRRRRRTWTAGAMALAAGMLLVVGVRAYSEARLERQYVRTLEGYVADLHERSQLLDAELRLAGKVTRVVSGWRASTIGGLEDRIRELDGELTVSRRLDPTAEQVGLLHERLELQDALLRIQVSPVSHRVF